MDLFAGKFFFFYQTSRKLNISTLNGHLSYVVILSLSKIGLYDRRMRDTRSK